MPTKPRALKTDVAKKPTQNSVHEDSLFNKIVKHGDMPIPVRQYMFAEPRKWRADFAWIQQRVIVEIEGGTFVGGRHVQGMGFEADCEKYNTATALGWRVLRFTPAMIRKGRAMRMLEWIFHLQPTDDVYAEADKLAILISSDPSKTVLK